MSGQPDTLTVGTVSMAGMCLWPSAPALESKGVSDPFSKSSRSLWLPACASQGFSYQKIVWCCWSGWS